MEYAEFLKAKAHQDVMQGFEPVFMPEFLFDFQRILTEWAIRKGKAALFEDCGLGKTPQQIVWAENVVKKANGNVLIIAPLAVSQQTVREGEKFGIEVHHTQHGEVNRGINITNYERLHHYNPSDFAGIVLDESSILKNMDGKIRKMLNEFALQIEYRLLCSATPAPNDYVELGTSAEILGVMTANQMMGMFFTHKADGYEAWLLKGHAQQRYWEWMATWARAIRKPSDLGCDDGKYNLPALNKYHHCLEREATAGYLFAVPALTLDDQRAERKGTLDKRCNTVASIIPSNRPAIVWCNYNDESDLLTRLIPDAVQIKGSDKADDKEQRLVDFTNGNIRVLVTKPSIAGYGLNWQHCSDVSFFPSHSYEQFYQAIRRCWRFGQEREVSCHLVYTQNELPVLDNMMRKERQCAEMFEGIVQHMTPLQKPMTVHKTKQITRKHVRLPKWIQAKAKSSRTNTHSTAETAATSSRKSRKRA